MARAYAAFAVAVILALILTLTAGAQGVPFLPGDPFPDEGGPPHPALPAV